MNLTSSTKIDKLLDSKNGASFSTLLTQLELLKKSDKKPEAHTKNVNYDATHFRFKKSLKAPESKASENENHVTMKNQVKDLISGRISTDQFRDALKNNGINPNVEAVFLNI